MIRKLFKDFGFKNQPFDDICLLLLFKGTLSLMEDKDEQDDVLFFEICVEFNQNSSKETRKKAFLLFCGFLDRIKNTYGVKSWRYQNYTSGVYDSAFYKLYSTE